MPRMPKRPDYGSATPGDLVRALMRPSHPGAQRPIPPPEERREKPRERERPA